MIQIPLALNILEARPLPLQVFVSIRLNCIGAILD